MASAAGTAALLLVSTALGVGMAEAGLRLFSDFRVVPQMFAADERVGYRLESNAREVTERPGVYTYRWRTNPQGFRGTETYQVPKAEGVRRVLMVGDSYTFGMGVEDPEVAASRLQRLLRNVCGDAGVQVVNMGVPSYGTSQELRTLEEYGLPLDPDLVVVSLVSNDMDDNLATGVHELVGDSLVTRPVTSGPGGGVYRWKRIANSIPGYRFLSRNSVLVGVIRQLGSQLARSRSLAGGGKPTAADSAATRANVAPDTTAAALRAAAVDPEGYRYRLMLSLLERMRGASEGAGARFVVSVIPDSWELRGYAAGRPQEAPMMTAALRMCDSLEVPCVNLADHLIRRAARGSTDRFYFAGDAHFNRTGHETMAAALLPVVARGLGCTGGSEPLPGSESATKPNDGEL